MCLAVFGYKPFTVDEWLCNVRPTAKQQPLSTSRQGPTAKTRISTSDSQAFLNDKHKPAPEILRDIIAEQARFTVSPNGLYLTNEQDLVHTVIP